jgi:predicted nuclease of predicted toxin-antitoxin system
LKLLLDMNLSPRLIQPLQDAGFEVSHWAQVGDPGATDFVLMEWARRNGAVVVTHDLDFSAMLAATRDASPSVVQVRTQNVLSDEFVGALIAALEQFSAMLQQGAIVVIDGQGRRARALPLK